MSNLIVKTGASVISRKLSPDRGDAIKVISSGKSMVIGCSIVDHSNDESAHRDGIQLIPKSDNARGQYSAAIMESCLISDNTIQAKNSKLQGIFASDGLFKDLEIKNNSIVTNSQHEVSISGMLSGKIFNNKSGDRSANIKLFPLRIGGNTGSGNVWISSFSNLEYEKIETDQHINDLRKVKFNDEDIFIDDFDIDLFRKKVSFLDDDVTVEEWCDSLKKIAIESVAKSSNEWSREPMIKKTLAEWALELDVQVEILEALASKETKGRGFRNGKPSILFERHIFWKELRKRGINPEDCEGGRDILGHRSLTSRRNAMPYNRYGSYAKQWDRFNRASSINEDAAICSISMGKFQVLGKNWKMCGFDSPENFFEENHEEEGQIKSFVGYVKNRKGLIQAMRDLDWNKIKLLYNGSRKQDRDGDGVDDYTQALIREYTRAVQRNNDRKPLSNSRTVKATASDATLKVGGGVTVVTAASYVEDILGKIKESTDKINDIKMQGDSAVESIKSAGLSLDNIQNAIEGLSWMPLFAVVVIVLLLIPNLRILYTYMHDNGYINNG